MFGLTKKSKEIESIVKKLSNDISSDKNPEAYRVVLLAKNDLDGRKQAPAVVANKLSNSLYLQKLNGNPALPLEVQPLIGKLKSLSTANGYGMVAPSVSSLRSYYE